MATLVLSAAGGIAGGAMGGSVLGLSAAVLGRAAGATLGQVIDQRLMGAGSEVIERGRVDRFRLTAAGEGTPVARLHGRTRLAGHVIWASDFIERRTKKRVGSGKGGSPSASVQDYSYSVSLAIALCEGEIGTVGRIWADGTELSRDQVVMRVYPGSTDQQPDPTLAAVEGLDNTPAYRGLAYVVFEDLNLAPFGNRVPQFSFEVTRPDRGIAPDGAETLPEAVRAVAMIPGTGEYALATSPVHYVDGPGRNSPANVHTGEGHGDIVTSFDQLQSELPNCGSVSLVVSWFGNDLRAGQCQLKPKVEHREAEGRPMPWKAGGLNRLSAPIVPDIDGQQVYGATPADASVVEAIREVQDRGLSVVFYPFILMDQLPGNGLPDPWGGAEQPPLPWRGRITTDRAPGQPGSPDGTVAADAEVAAFFGTAQASDFTVGNGSVSYNGPNEWGMRRFILHYAALCAAAGGVDAFCIGSEMRALTSIRGATGFPAVQALRDLAHEVRALLGPGVKLGYAADWSEYFGHAPADGSGDRYFHLDPLWADAEIDFVGIDNYMPVSDWRDGPAHADATAGWESIYDLDYLKANIEGGEGFDWYYANAQDVDSQTRTGITDGAHNEPWIWRYKDLRSWWSLPHHERIGGVRQAQPTAWQPFSKPIWFTELGCAAVDKGTNEPNKFVDPKSSESALPRGSTGVRDDLIQMQYLRAMMSYWQDPAHNPVSPVYGAPMLDMSRAHVWAWDARPWPWFPGLGDVWADRDNYITGHWLNGRTAARLLSSVVQDICATAGLGDADCTGLHGLVRGYAISDPGAARTALEPLMTAFGFQAVEAGGRLRFVMRAGAAAVPIDPGELAVHPETEGDLSYTRAADGENAGRVRLVHLEADGSYATATSESIHPGAETQAVAQTEMNLVLSEAEARRITERWLSEARVARDSVQLALPPSRLDVGPGDVVELPGPSGPEFWRIDRLEEFGASLAEAVRVEPALYLPAPVRDTLPALRGPAAPVPVSPVFLDLPLLTGEELPHAPHLAVAARPWPGEVAAYAAPTDSGYELNTLIDKAALIGSTLDPLPAAIPGLLDRGPMLRVRLSGGGLSGVSAEELLSGANAMAIGDGTPGNWEIFQFQQAVPVGADVWALGGRLRGQLGTDALMPQVWPVGSVVVLLDDAVGQISLAASARGVERNYRIVPAGQPIGGPSAVHLVHAFAGNGLRPYAPVHLRRAITPGGDHRFTWIRRTRLDGDLWDMGDVPLGETGELYHLRISTANGPVRSLESGGPDWTYTAAQRAADGVGPAYTFDVAQISDRYGPGLYRRIEIDDNNG
ncbi:MAG: glycoside hydrolase/phage tail family protein [Qingshengfaniella sp.]